MKLKILIANDGYHAHYFIRLGHARAFAACGHDVVMWDISKKPTNDAFDTFEPHIFIGQTYNVDRVLEKAIEERPHLKVIMKGSDWGEMQSKIDLKEYPVLVAREDEKETLLRIKERTGKPNYLEIHYHHNWINQTHGEWIKNGIPVVSHLSAADTFEFHGKMPDRRFSSDITFIGGYWPYKAKVLDKYLIPLCRQNKYNVKIFGNGKWPVPQYCGFIDERYTGTALASAKICPNLHEPHSQAFGYDIVERPFKLLSMKTFVISDYVEGLHDILPDSMLFAKSPTEFSAMIDEWLEKPKEREEIANRGYYNVMRKHTYFHRVYDIFNRLGLEEQADECMKKYKELYAL